MTEQEIEEILDKHIFEDFKHRLWITFPDNKQSKDKCLLKHGLIYLCKKCYELGLEYGIQIK